MDQIPGQVLRGLAGAAGLVGWFVWVVDACWVYGVGGLRGKREGGATTVPPRTVEASQSDSPLLPEATRTCLSDLIEFGRSIYWWMAWGCYPSHGRASGRPTTQRPMCLDRSHATTAGTENSPRSRPPSPAPACPRIGDPWPPAMQDDARVGSGCRDSESKVDTPKYFISRGSLAGPGGSFEARSNRSTEGFD